MPNAKDSKSLNRGKGTGRDEIANRGVKGKGRNDWKAKRDSTSSGKRGSIK